MLKVPNRIIFRKYLNSLVEKSLYISFNYIILLKFELNASLKKKSCVFLRFSDLFYKNLFQFLTS